MTFIFNLATRVEIIEQDTFKSFSEHISQNEGSLEQVVWSGQLCIVLGSFNLECIDSIAKSFGHN